MWGIFFQLVRRLLVEDLLQRAFLSADNTVGDFQESYEYVLNS